MKTVGEQQIWNECSRLIANTIIYYNMLLLSGAYERKLAVEDKEAIRILKGISPVAWRNINLIGNFDFTTGTSPVDIELWQRTTKTRISGVGLCKKGMRMIQNSRRG